MKFAAYVIMGLLGMVPLAQYYWLTGGEFSFLLGLFFLAGAWGIVIGAGRYLKRKPFVFAFLSGILFPWIIKGLFFLGTLPASGRGSYLFVLFDTDFSLILPLYYLIFLFFLFSHRFPGQALWLLSVLVLISGGALYLFKSQGGVIDLKISLIWTISFLILGIHYLVFFHQITLFHNRSALRKGEGVLLLAFLFLGGSLLLLRSYGEKSIAEGGGLLQNDLFQFDFSDVLKLQSEIAMSDELVMLFRKEGKAERLLIRRFILDKYEKDRGFFREGKADDVPAGGIRFEDPGYEHRAEVFQEYYLINMNPSVALGLNYPLEITPYGKWDGSSFQRVFHTTSMVSTGTWWQLFTEKEILMEGEERAVYTDYGKRQDIARLAEEITQDKVDPVSKVKAVERYLKENYYYSLRPGSSVHGDQLGYFLFVSKKGYCSYFAFAMTLMLRSLDIPARVVVGFWVDPNSEVLNFYPVAANQAHAWVEVYFNEWGWLEFDPTSQNMAEGENYQFGRVDYEEYGRLIEEIIRNKDELEEEVPDPLQAAVDETLRRAVRQLGARKREIGLSLLFLYVSWVLLSRCLPRDLGGNSPEKSVIFIYVRIRKELYRTGYPGRRGETPMEYARRIEKTSPLRLTGITSFYLKSEFSRSFSDSDGAGAIIAREEYRLSRKKLSLVRRVLCLLYPFPQIRRYL